MAKWSAQRIEKLLNLPTTLITDKPVADSIFDKVILINKDSSNTKHYSDYQKTIPWHNNSRDSVYGLTPYDQTLLLDADYVVNSQQLKILFDTSHDLLCPSTAYDISNVDTIFSETFGKYHMPMMWATIMYFRKSGYSEYVFSLMQMIKHNWQHYRNLYQISNKLYRNDFALSIALNIVNGHSNSCPTLPWSMATVMPEHTVKQKDFDKFEVSYCKNNRGFYVNLVDQDFHAMNKKQLGELIACNQ
jgi:hypothetical protein